MQQDGKDVDNGGGPDWSKIGAGLVIGGGMAAAAAGVVLESAGLVALGAGILVAGLVLVTAAGASAGDSGGSAGSEGDPGGGETGGTEAGCFTAGTVVMMASGELKAIAAVRCGDYVMSREEPTGKTAPQRVTHTWTHQVPATLLLRLTSGETIETTKEHRFFVADAGFVGAGRIACGSTFANYGGQTLRMAAVEPAMQSAEVYNLEVENFHTYFIGNGGVWVHNRKESNPIEQD